MMKHPLPYLILASSLLSVTVKADHGRDFLLLQDAHFSAPLGGTLYSNFDWTDHADAEEWGNETGFMIGIMQRLNAGLNFHFSDVGDGWNYTSVSPHLLLDLTPEKSPIRIALFAGYEFGEDDGTAHSHHGGEPHTHSHRTASKTQPRRRGSAAGAHSHAAGAAAPAAGQMIQCGPEFGPDSPPCDETDADHDHSTHDHSAHDHGSHSHGGTASPHRHSARTHHHKSTSTKRTAHKAKESHDHRGIHRHGESGFHARLILEADVTQSDKLVLNIINVTPEDGKPAWGYAAGFRHSFTHDIAVGLEATGDFGDANEHLLVAGAYFSPLHSLTLKFGVGLGLTDDSPDLGVKAGAVWRF